MLAGTNDCVVFQVFFNNSQNNLLHNFASHRSETDGPIVTGVIPVVLLEDWDNICQLPELGPLQIPKSTEKSLREVSL